MRGGHSKCRICPCFSSQTSRRPAVNHYRVQFLLRLFQVQKVAPLEHFTVITHHLCDVDWIVTTVFRAVLVDFTKERPAMGRLMQPGASRKIVASRGVNPDPPTVNVAKNIRPMIFPPVDLFRRGRQAAIARCLTAFAASVTALHWTRAQRIRASPASEHWRIWTNYHTRNRHAVAPASYNRRQHSMAAVGKGVGWEN